MAHSSFTFDRSQRRSRRRLVWVSVLVAALIIFDIVSGGMLRALARRAGADISVVNSKISAALFGSGYFVSHASLAEQNAALKDEVARYQEEGAAYAYLKQQNADLQSFVHLAQTEQGITAPIVSSVFSSPYGTFIVGAGKDSVSAGDLVLTPEGFVAGVISETDSKTSVVKEVFAPGATMNVQIGKHAAQAYGRGGGNARATLPRELSVQTGDAVTDPQYGGRPVGVVGKVQSSPSDAGQTVYIDLPVDLSALHYVYLTHPL